MYFQSLAKFVQVQKRILELQPSTIKLWSPKIVRACSRSLYVCLHNPTQEFSTQLLESSSAAPQNSMLSPQDCIGAYQEVYSGYPPPDLANFIMFECIWGSLPENTQRALYILYVNFWRVRSCILGFWNCIFELWRNVLKSRSVFWSSSPPTKSS